MGKSVGDIADGAAGMAAPTYTAALANKADVKGKIGVEKDKPGEKEVLTPSTTYADSGGKPAAKSDASDKSLAAIAVEKILKDFQSKDNAAPDKAKTTNKAQKGDPSKDAFDHP